MDYEQKYKEALKKAQKELQCCDDLDCDAARQIFRLFPELINEDERIREEILSVVKQFDKNTTLCGKNYDYNKWIAWLEKQGEEKVYSVWVGGSEINDYYLTEKEAKKLTREYKEKGYDDVIIEKQGEQKYDVPDTPIKDSEEVTSRMKHIDENLKPIAEFVMGYANWDLRKDEWNHPVATVPLFRVLDALVQNGKQYSEEYSVVDNNTKPKFKAGDWITNGDYTWKIVEVKPLDYILQSQDGNIVDDTISHVDTNFNLWTIQDAKDGDVLVFDGIIMIFKSIKTASSANTYILYYNRILFDDWCDFGYNAHPATKEQRDFLFQKMHEVGYEWYAETKQLIKIQS